jgi:hypothetical protein
VNLWRNNYEGCILNARCTGTRLSDDHPVPLKELTFHRLTLLIDEVLRNPEYRENANSMRRVIADTNGLEKAVDLLEEAFGLRRPLERL